MSYRAELIQTAAVAVAMVENYDYGQANASETDPYYGTTRTEVVLAEVLAERENQDAKWGPQEHSAAEWVAILAEEVGEVAEEVKSVPKDRGPVTEGHLWEIVYRTRTLGRIAKARLDRFIFPKENK